MASTVSLVPKLTVCAAPSSSSASSSVTLAELLRSRLVCAKAIGGPAAERIGLVNRVVADAQLDAFVQDWATRLAAGPPIALAQTKRLLNNSANVTLEEALDDEGAAQVINFGTKDTVEAMTAFIENANHALLAASSRRSSREFKQVELRSCAHEWFWRRQPL